MAGANSFVDLFVNKELSAKGYTKMAFLGIFSSQIFNLLFGFGFSMVLKGIKIYMSPRLRNNSNLKFGLYSISGIFHGSKSSLLTFNIITFTLVTLLLILYFSLKNK